MLRTLLVDNYDSFTHNLADLLHRVNGAAPHVVPNDAPWSDIDLHAYDCVVVSPGPGRPQRERDLGISALALKQTQVPALGICLGHQGICHLHGGRVGHAPEPMHGRICEVHHPGTDLFEGLPSPFKTVRYHSLAVNEVPADLEPLAWTADGVVMAVRSLRAPQWGVQFHPESVLTEYGAELLHNFRRLVESATGAATGRRRPAVARPRYRLECRQVDARPDTAALFLDLYGSSANAFWLDSSRTDPAVGRFTIMGDDSGPLAEHLAYSVTERAWTITRDGRSTRVAAGFFDYLNGQLAARRVEHPPELPIDFNLGYVGALGYELKAETGGRSAHVSPLPDAQLVFADRAIVVDHREDRTYLLALADPLASETVRDCSDWLDRTAEAVLRHSTATGPASAPPLPGAPPRFRFDQSPSAYLDSIAACLEAIVDGESYEICLTNTAEAAPLTDPLTAYLRLRAASPVPFGAYLRTGSTAILSASPERFLQARRDGRIQAKPIKGTRPRGETPQLDAALKRDLAGNPKDRAENLMIVDLLRNDLHRVCAVGTVHVPKLFDVETYAHVHQLVSTIEGRLAPGRTAVDCIRAAFPGGSMTGAPKIRTMEIIDELEHRARGYYSGAIGWISLSGAADLSIVIRTIVNTERSCTFGVGGAIVALSDPEEEYRETLVKSRAMVSALDATIENA